MNGFSNPRSMITCTCIDILFADSDTDANRPRILHVMNTLKKIDDRAYFMPHYPVLHLFATCRIWRMKQVLYCSVCSFCTLGKV